MTEMTSTTFFDRRSTKEKKVRFLRNSISSVEKMSSSIGENNFLGNVESESTIEINVRPTIHWGPVIEGDQSNSKEQINTDTDHFDALFARSKVSSGPKIVVHPRSYSTCSPMVDGISSRENDPSHRPNSARTKRKNFSLTHGTQIFLQTNNGQNEQFQPLERSCSYKRPQSMKKYRQKKKDKEQSATTTNNSRQSNPTTSSVSNNASSKSIGTTTATGRISTNDLMTPDDPQDHWSNLESQRSGRLGSLPLDQLQLPTEPDQEVYRVRQFHTTSKGFVNRGDSFKRSFKRSGSITRRSSFRTNPNFNVNERTNSQEQDQNPSSTGGKETRTSNHSLTNSSGTNLNGMVDTHLIENNVLLTSSIPSNDEEEDENLLVETIQTADGRLQNIRVYQVFLLGMSGTGKCSLIRQFKTTEYRGIYDYSSSIDDDPDNTVSIMLDGIESRLHMVTVDVDSVKSKLTADAFVVVYSITDRQSFQTAVQIVKNVRENQSENLNEPNKFLLPIILVGNKSDLVRKRLVTKEMARHAAIKYRCKLVETSAAINDKVDDLLAGTLKQIRLVEQTRADQRRRLTLVGASFETNDSETPILNKTQSTNLSTSNGKPSKNIFAKFFSVFKKKPTNFQIDVENLNTPFSCK